MQSCRAISLLAVAAISCGRAASSESGATQMSSELKEDLAIVRRSRVYFYHHSVGENVLAGLARLDAEAGGERLKIGSPTEARTLDGPMLVHGGGGENKKPKSKIDAFVAAIRDAPLKPDLAFMKFCYVDFAPNTDVDEVFTYYRSSLEALKREFPQTRFAHVTVPVTARETDLKSSVRRLLGLSVWGDASNVKRAEFSKRIKEAFPADPLFDLALVEATAPDGGTSTFQADGRMFLSLDPNYTEDGGHLNDLGQRVAARAAVRFLAESLK